MGAILNLRHILKKRILVFVSRFLRVWLQIFQKVLIWPKMTQNLTLISNPLKKLLKMHQKSYKQNKFEPPWVKVKKVHISVTFLLILFCVHFFQTFSTDSKSAWNSAFFDTHTEFLNEFFLLLLLALFVYFDCKCTQNGSKNINPFYECVLEFN